MKKLRFEALAERHWRTLRKRRGAALVIILAFVVLLTVLVVAYFSFAALQRQISQAGVNQAAAAIFAEGVLQTTIGDLRSEIAAGSIVTNVGAGGTIPIYYPSAATNAVPARVGTADSLPNLVKRSASGLAFYPGGPARASGISTTNASQNGRYFTPDRWNAAYLLPKASTNAVSDSTPISAFVAPDWIFVARDGSNPTAWNDNLRWSGTNATTVVGRYAYAIYDEGGLLDINVAGFPPGASTNFTQDKGGLAYADLTVLPGMTTNAVSAIVGWRNYASSQPAGNLPSYVFTSAAQTNYFQAIQTNTSGFLRTANTNMVSGQGDRRFVSRQQLIQFLSQGVAQTDAERAGLQNALQYLGTFSRDLEQPSFRPDPNRPKNTTHDWAGGGAGFGGNDAYDPTGAKQDRINPWLLAVRDANDLPVMKRRFPLSRLALLEEAERILRSGNSLTAGLESKILSYFGLAWEAGTSQWKYDHGDPGRIYSLSEIPDGREPDFFEVLKAVINCDSIGKQYGGTEAIVPHQSIHQFTGTAAAVDGVIHYQLLRLGANVIDQYDKDSYPTSIALGGANARTFHGVENLPYLQGWIQSWYRMKQLSASDFFKQPSANAADGYPFEVWMVFQPILWNPHAPDPNLDVSLVPTNFRVTAGSRSDGAVTLRPQTRPSWWVSGYVTQYDGATTDSVMAHPDWSAATFHPAISQLTFNAAPNTVSGVPSAFQEPYRLLYQVPAGSNADAPATYAAGKFALDAQGSIADPLLAGVDATVDNKTIIGFFGGKGWAGPWKANTPVAGESGPCLSGGSTNTSDIALTLQYQDSNGTWRTYDRISQVYTAGQPSTFATIDNEDIGAQIRAFPMGMRADPRTDRWGLFTMKSFPLAANPTGVAISGSNQIHNASIYNFPQGTTLSPNAGMNAGCVYRLVRNASGVPLVEWSTAPYLSDLTVNLNTGNSASYLPGRKFYYNDPDHVLRRASGAYFSSTTTLNSTDGLPMATGNFESRPVILNRPFRSVAEMGCAFSDTPWKEINFLTPESGDAALLDAFCLDELDAAPDNVVVAGRVNLNTRQPKVIEALIQGVSKAEGGVMPATEAAQAAQVLVDWTTDLTSQDGGILTKGPLRNRSELVGKFVRAVSYTPPASSNLPNIGYDGNLSYSGFSSALTGGAGGIFAIRKDSAIKRRRESVLRALADSGNARTWNLTVDLVAQTGRFSLNALNLNQFTVEGESRVWLHLAIDRYTGRVIAREMETVSE